MNKIFLHSIIILLFSVTFLINVNAQIFLKTFTNDDDEIAAETYETYEVCSKVKAENSGEIDLLEIDDAGYKIYRIPLFKDGFFNDKADKVKSIISLFSEVTLEEQLENDILNALENIDSSISFNSSVNEMQIFTAFMNTVNNNPQLFYVTSKVSLKTSSNGSLTLYFYYTDSVSNIIAQKNVFDAQVKDILSNVESSMSSVEKALVVHDYFVSNYEYDYDNYLNDTIPDESYTPQGLFINRTGVCQAYSEGYKYIMNMLGIETVTISSSRMNHAWNMINIDGYWYHVDTTWDDPAPDRSGGYVKHQYFLVSDDAMSDSTRKHHGWVSKHTATNTKYDSYFWTGVTTPIHIANGFMYYIYNADGRIVKRNTVSDTEFSLYTIPDRWPVRDMANYFWVGKFSGIGYYNNRIYFNTPRTINSVDIDGKNLKTEYTVSSSTTDIYSMYVRGNQLTYCLSTSPSDSIESMHTYNLTVQQASAPTSNIPVGNVLSGTLVELSTETSDAEIKYTLDGSDPTQDSITYVAPIEINDSTKLKAIAIKHGLGDSDVSEYVYNVSLAPSIADVSFLRNENTVTGSLNVKLQNNTQSNANCTIALGIYDNRGVLVYMNYKNNQTVEKGHNLFTYSGISLTGLHNTKYQIVLFVWEANRMQPLSISKKRNID